MTLTWTAKRGTRPQTTATGVAGDFIAWPLRLHDGWAVKLQDRGWLPVGADLEACKAAAQGREDAACRRMRRSA